MLLPYLDAQSVLSALSWTEVVEALADALRTPSDGLRAMDRIRVPVSSGELLLMPAETTSAVGVKVVGVAPGNSEHGLPRIQGMFILMNVDTLTPMALMDGTALTNIRTPGLSALAVRELARPDSTRLVVFGSGPQARGHIAAVRSVRPIESVRIVARNPVGIAAIIAGLEETELDVRAGTPADVSNADVVVCATTARSPVFDGARLAEGACVVAVGSHEPDARELDVNVFRRAARVVVEDCETALREAGDVISAVAAHAFAPESLIDLRSLVQTHRSTSGISVFKSVGMAWQDLAVAEAIWSGDPRSRWR